MYASKLLTERSPVAKCVMIAEADMDAAERIARKVKEGNAKVYDADLSSYFDTIPHDKLLSALEMRIADGSVLNLVLQWLKACAREPNGVMV